MIEPELKPRVSCDSESPGVLMEGNIVPLCSSHTGGFDDGKGSYVFCVEMKTPFQGLGRWFIVNQGVALACVTAPRWG